MKDYDYIIVGGGSAGCVLISGVLSPGPDAQSDEDILARAKDRLGLVYHPSGT